MAAKKGRQGKPRARDLGIPFEGRPGTRNAIVDVGHVAVGHTTIIREPDVHTGVTAIWPRGKHDARPVHAAFNSLNGNGELTGTHWIKEAGVIEGPLALTNTYSVGTVRDAILSYLQRNWKRLRIRTREVDYGALPVVAETWDGELNDIYGFHVKARHVHAALDRARDKNSPGPIEEGNVGGGTGMTLYDFKGGIGTSSRVVRSYTKHDAPRHHVGVLAQCNFGTMRDLIVAGVPIGAIFDPDGDSKVNPRRSHHGSVIVVVATDAPLMPHELERLSRRVTHGLARTGAISEDTSGDLFVAFSTAQVGVREAPVSSDSFNALFEGVVHATEEAVVNALIAAETMGRRGEVYDAIDHDDLVLCLRYHRRLGRGGLSNAF